MIQTNPLSYSQTYICADYVSNKEEQYMIIYVLRQGVPQGRSSEGYASFKQVRSWSWHVEAIPGVGVVRQRATETGRKTETQRETGRQKETQRDERQTDRQRHRETDRIWEADTNRHRPSAYQLSTLPPDHMAHLYN